MNAELKKRIPDKPNWRWLLYHELLGRDHEDVEEPTRLLARYLKDTYSKKKTWFKKCDLVCLLKWERDGDEDIDRAMKLREEPPIQQLVNHMLDENCEIDWIQEAIYHKFNENLSERTIELYRSIFWDTESLNSYDMRQFYRDEGRPPPPAPNVPGSMRSAYIAYKAGASVNIDHDEIAEDMFLHCYFRSKELAQYQAAADDTVIDYQKMALKAYKALQESDFATNEGLPEIFDRPVKHHDSAIEAVDLDGYDPDEDAGYSDE